MNLAVGVTQSAGIAVRYGIKAGLKLELMEVRIECALLVVVVHLALAKHDVADTQVENARALVGTFEHRQIRFTVLGNKHACDWMIDNNVFQVPRALKQRHHLNADAEM